MQSIVQIAAKSKMPLENFWMVGLHTRPSNTIWELHKLEDVYNALGKPKRVVFLGDFNADGDYFREYDEDKIPFLFGPKTEMNMLQFKNDAKTNLNRDKTYDRIVVSNSVLGEVQGKQAEVDNIPTDNPERVSCNIYDPLLLMYTFLGVGLGMTGERSFSNQAETAR